MLGPSLVIQLLGPPRVTVNGAPLRVDTRKALAILAYLVVTGQPQAREHLAALLWPDADDAAARGALRRTLSTLRAALGGRHVVVERGAVWLERDGVVADVWRLREAGDRSDDRDVIEAAVRGEFLAGFGLRDAPDFDDWVLAEADAWRQRSIAVLAAAAEREAVAGNIDAAIATARRRIDLDRLDEGAHRQLMTLYARAGDRAAAVRQYRACVRLLAEELDVEPLPATSALYEAILAGAAVEPPSVPVPRIEERPMLPLVGRDDDLRVLEEAWRSPGIRLVLIEGEAGIGKTRLAGELASLVEGHGGRVVALHGYPTHQAPYAALAELIERQAAQPDRLAMLDPPILAEVARLVPGLPRSAASATIDGPGAEARFVDAMATALDRLAGDLLVVDDAQWIDPATIGIVAKVARRRERTALVVVCRRPTEAADDPLLPALLEARRTGRLVRIRLDRLGRDEVRRLVRSAAPGVDADALHAESAGVPFYLAERLAALLTGAEADEIPAGIRDLVRSRVTACSQAARQTLAACAVVGGTFDPDLIHAVSGRSTEETVDALDELEAHGIVVPRQGTLEIDHELTRTVVLDDLGVGRRRILHRRTADALARRRGRLRVPADVAAHLAAAGDDAGAARWYAIAGERASELHAHAEAIEQYGAALGLAPSPDPRWHERIGERWMLLGRYADAVRAFDLAAASLPADEVWRAELGMARAHRFLGSLDLAAAHLDAASSTVGGEPRARTAVEMERARIADRLGRVEAAASHARAALAAARESDDPLDLAQAHNVCALLARHRGEVDHARGHLSAALDISGRLGRPAVGIAALNNLALLELAERDLTSAETLLRRALAMSEAIRDRHHEAALRNNLADVLRATGRRDEAIREVGRSAAILAELGGVGAGGKETSPEVWRLVDW